MAQPRYDRKFLAREGHLQRRVQEAISRSPVFLVLGLGFDQNYPIHRDPAPRTLCTLKRPHAIIRRVILLEDEHDQRKHRPAPRNERLLIQLKQNKARKDVAIKILNAVQALFVCFQRLSVEDFGICRIPFRGIIKKGAVFMDELLLVGKATREFGYPDEWLVSRLASFTIVPESVMAHLFFFLPFVLSSESLFDACHFFEACSSQYNFVGDDVSEICKEPDQTPETEQERLRLENVVLSAYRTVEAIVGEPGREPRFRLRLNAWGIDFDEPVGFRGYLAQPLGQRIYWLQDTRDEAAAHGRRRRRKPLTFFEAMEAQELANSVLHEALWHEASMKGRNEGPPRETAYLLSRMLGERSSWFLRRQERLESRIPVEMVRKPGTGLKDLLHSIRDEHSGPAAKSVIASN